MPSRPSELRSSQQARRTPAYRRAASSLGARVRELRLASELTLERASERGGLDLKHWQKVEAGQLNVTLVTLLRIARGLNVEIADLFTKSRR